MAGVLVLFALAIGYVAWSSSRQVAPAPACPQPPAFDRTRGCAETASVAQDSDGFFYFVRRCDDGTALMIPVPGMPPDTTPRAKPPDAEELPL